MSSVESIDGIPYQVIANDGYNTHIQFGDHTISDWDQALFTSRDNVATAVLAYRDQENNDQFKLSVHWGDPHFSSINVSETEYQALIDTGAIYSKQAIESQLGRATVNDFDYKNEISQIAGNIKFNFETEDMPELQTVDGVTFVADINIAIYDEASNNTFDMRLENLNQGQQQTLIQDEINNSLIDGLDKYDSDGSFVLVDGSRTETVGDKFAVLGESVRLNSLDNKLDGRYHLQAYGLDEYLAAETKNGFLVATDATAATEEIEFGKLADNLLAMGEDVSGFTAHNGKLIQLPSSMLNPELLQNLFSRIFFSHDNLNEKLSVDKQQRNTVAV